MNPIVRRPARLLVRGAALGALAMVVLSATPALADTPSSWEQSPDVTAGHMLLLLLVIPLALMGLIALLAALPSMIKGNSYEPHQAWRSEGEWFGGPRQGVEGADALDPQALESAGRETGGASGRY